MKRRGKKKEEERRGRQRAPDKGTQEELIERRRNDNVREGGKTNLSLYHSRMPSSCRLLLTPSTTSLDRSLEREER